MIWICLIVTVSFAGDKYFNADEKTAAFKVNKVDSTLTVSDIEFDYGGSGSAEVVVDGALGFNASVDDDNAVVNVDGNVITVSGLDACVYTLTVTTVGDENHNAVTGTAVITVNKLLEPIDPSLTVSADDFKFGEDAVLVIKTNNNFSGNVLVQFDGSNYTLDIVDGTGSLELPVLAAGQYTAKVIFAATEIFKASEVDVTFSFSKLSTAATSVKVSTTYGTSKNLVVTLNDENGNVLANKKITVKLNSKTYTRTTNSKGQGSVVTPKTLAVKTYTASITFAGDDNYVKSTASQKVAVSKATPKLVLKTKKFKRTSSKKYAATLKTDKNAAFKSVKVTLKVQGKTYSAKTNSKGQAIFKITKLTKKGKFTALVKFAGNSKYKEISKKIQLTVV